MRRARLVAIGGGILVLFLVLLVAGILPRVRSNDELNRPARDAKSSVPAVYVIHAEPAAEGGLSLAATTQAIQDSIIYARTNGYISKRYVDIGDHVDEGQLLAEIASPEVDQQLSQAEA